MRAGVKLVRGMRDRLAATQHGLSHVVDTAARVATHAQYVQVATPIIETTALFTHAIGEGTDVVNKEMFSFVDGARGESVSLRPEGTAGVLRAALTAKEFRGSPLVQKFYYHGPMFRRERPQKGRYRQFEQFGVENLGCSHPHTDVEVISLGQQLLTELGLAEEAELQINSLCDAETRVRHHTLLTAFLQSHADQLSTTSQERLAAGHVLRILDSKDPGDGSVVESAPRLLDVATEAAQTRFAEVLAGLDVLGIPYTVNHRLVRGLDYYSSTVWEFTTSRLGAQGAILAGGRYDGLATQLGASAEVPAIGWAAGVDRLALLQAECGEVPTPEPPAVSVVQVRGRGTAEDDATARLACLALANALRSAGVSTNYIHTGNVRKQMSFASDTKSHFSIVIGATEVAAGEVVLKNMQTGEQSPVAYTADASAILAAIAGDT